MGCAIALTRRIENSIFLIVSPERQSSFDALYRFSHFCAQVPIRVLFSTRQGKWKQEASNIVFFLNYI